MTDISLPDYSNLKPGQTFEAPGPYIHARHGSVTKSRTIVRRSSWQVPPGLGILSVGRPVIETSKRASLEVIVKQAGSVVYDNSLKLSIDKAAKDLMGKLNAGKYDGDAAGAYNSFNAKLDAVHRLAASTHGGIELVAKLRPKNRFSGGGGAWITAYVDVVFVVVPSENTFEQVLAILNLGLSSDYQGDVIDLFKEATKVFGLGSAVSDDDDDEEEDDEIVELDEDDDEDTDDHPKQEQDEGGEGDKGPNS